MSRPLINERGDIQLGAGHTGNAALNDRVEEFLARLKAKKYTPATVKKRRDSLRRFLLFLQARGVERFADVDAGLLDAFRLCLVDHAYSEYEIESSLRAVLFLFRDLRDGNELFDNPAERLKIPKATPILGRTLSQEDLGKLLAVPDLTRPQGLRDRALLETLYSTGMRRGEAAGLALHDVDLDRATVKVRGKGRKERLLPLGKHAVKYLRLYLTEARPRFVPKFALPSDALWLDRRRGPMSPMSVCHVVTACGRAAGVPSDTHTLRRTCATELLRGGAHPAVVAQLLGHSGLGTLSHYLRTSIGDLKKAHALTNPGK